MKKVIIAAISKNGVIANRGKIPWNSTEEIQHFRNTTLNFPVIMGRKTFQSLDKPLEFRTNIIISRQELTAKDIRTYDDLHKAFQYCENELKADKVFIIGGGEVFRETIDEADEMIISQMNFEYNGDIYFPEINKSMWDMELLKKYNEFNVYVYKRKEIERKCKL